MGCLQSSEKEEKPALTDLNTEAPKKVDPRLPFESYRQLFNLKNSWKSVARKLESAAKDNLKRFLKEYPQHKAIHRDLKKFDDDEKMYASDAFEMAAMSVYNTFDMAMDKIDGNVDESIAAFQRAGRMHSKVKDFNVEFFKDMEESFIEAAREILQDRFNDATEKNFRLLYQFACQEMIVGYNKAVGGGNAPNRV